MTWTAYKVSFRLLSPMHVGWRKLGNLQQTRPYMTGRNLWGALTARLTREQLIGNYEEVGKKVDVELAFTYFYPSMSSICNVIKPWPWGDGWDTFAWQFLGSYASTSLENGRNAEAGSLHETEFIAPYTREGQAVYLVGYIFEKEGCQLKWQSVLNKIQFGGERSYGWGRVLLEEQPEKVQDGKCFGYELECTEEQPVLTAPNNMRLLAHTIVNDTDTTDGLLERGVSIEPLMGRETQGSKGYGNSFSTPEICWVPGGKVATGERFQILAKGIWKHYK